MARPRSPANSPATQKVTSRPGEGSNIGYATHHVSNPDGTTVVSLALNFNTAQVPDRRYVANIADIQVDGDLVVIIFGQNKLGGAGFRSLMLIEMNSTAVHRFLNSSKDLVSNAVGYAERNKFARTSLVDIREDAHGQTIPFSANLVAVGYTGRDACMDFYYASPFGVQIASAGGDLDAEPVVRVTMSTATMVAIYQRLEAIKVTLPNEEESEVHDG